MDPQIIQPNIEPTINEKIIDAKTNQIDRLPLADHLGSDEDMRSVIQVLVDEIQTLTDRVKVLESDLITKTPVV